MQEIEARLFGQISEQIRAVAGPNVVPAHVRQMRLVGELRNVKPLDFVIDPT